MAKPEKKRHPFDEPEIIHEVENYAPEYAEALRACVRPALSAHPDEMEHWEAGQIERRKQRLDFESDFSYLVRVLYEESFSVNQTFGRESFEGSYGFTVGGLVSHCYVHTYEDAKLLQDVLMNVRGETLREALKQEPNYGRRWDIVSLVFQSSYPLVIGDSSSGPPRGPMYRVEKDPDSNYPKRVDAFGFRLLKLLTRIPAFLADVQDPAVRKRLGAKEGERLPLARAVNAYWATASRTILYEDGGLKRDSDLKSGDQVKRLLEMRTNPAFEIMYKHFSPSGCLNERASG